MACDPLAPAGRREREVDAPQVEDHREVHRHGRVHRLENIARADHRRVPPGADDVDPLDHRCRTAVVAVDDSHLVRRQVGLVHPRVAHRLGGGHVGIFALLGQTQPLAAVEHPFQVRLFHDPRQRRNVPQLPARRIEPDARASFAERLRDFFRIFSDAGPDAHSGDDYSLLHGLRYISPR